MFSVLHIADFPLHAVLRTERDVAHRPAALFANTSKRSVVLAANDAARAAGVELGMTAPQAVARCPALLIRAPQPAAEAEARAALLAVGFTLSPSIEDTAPGVCTVDVAGLDPAQRSTACRAAITELAALGLPATAGLATTPLLALYAARTVCPTPDSQRSALSSSASARIRQVTDVPAFLHPLPLAAADPPPELAAVLHHWGLRTLGDLIALPRDEIIRRFGAAGLALWQRASGGAPRPLHPVALPQTFAATHEFEEAVETLEPLLFLLRRFLERLTLELRASQHVAVELHLALQLENDTQHARSFRLPEPTADVEILFRALHTHLEALTTPAAIAALALTLQPARPLVRQQGLFDTGLRDPHAFAETLARLTALTAPDRVGTPQLEETHRPDALKLIAPPATISPPADAPLHPPLGLPLRRFRPPLPARLNELSGAAFLWSAEIRGEIAARSAPYPSSGDWWQADRTWSRVEWDITLAEGGCYRLLQIGPDYFIEGEYD